MGSWHWGMGSMYVIILFCSLINPWFNNTNIIFRLVGSNYGMIAIGFGILVLGGKFVWIQDMLIMGTLIFDQNFFSLSKIVAKSSYSVSLATAWHTLSSREESLSCRVRSQRNHLVANRTGITIWGEAPMKSSWSSGRWPQII